MPGGVCVVSGVDRGRQEFYARVIGAALMLACPPAFAETPDEEERSPASSVIFGSLEAGATKTLASVGLKRAIGSAGLDSSGFRLGLKWSESVEQERQGRLSGQLVKTELHAGIGYEWRIGDTFLSIAAGPDLEAAYSQYTGTIVLTHKMGARAHLDLWTRPSERSLLQVNAYVSTLDQRAWLRVSPGWTLMQELYVGPELELYRQDNYRKLRLGLHVTGLRLFGLNWRLSGGLQKTSDRPGEAYATLGIYWRR